MIGFDLYPLQNWCRPERLVDVYSQRELVDLGQGEADLPVDRGGGQGRARTTARLRSRLATVRAESWLAIAGGAKRSGSFRLPPGPVTWERRSPM